MFETFDHTADLGLRITAPTLSELFSESARALVATIVENPATIREVCCDQFQVAGTDREYLLFDWLKLLLFRFDAEHKLYARFDVNVRDDGILATAWGETLDPDRHILANEVKAITYHGLKVEQRPDDWIAEVIVDI